MNKLPTPSEYSKQKVFRNRKKHGSMEMQRLEQSKRGQEAPHPKHQPYNRRDKKQYLCGACGDTGIMTTGSELDTCQFCEAV